MKSIKKWGKLLCVLLCILSMLAPSIQLQAASKPSVHAHAYVIMDANTGKILFSKNSTKKIYPASTVKLMTALVVLDKCSTSKTIKVKKKMLKGLSPEASKVGLRPGNTYTVSALLHMLLLPSAADAAVVLANGTYGSQKAFCKAMNKKAKELGLSKTSFDNPIGLDIGDNYKKTYTTAKDFSNLARYAMANKTIRSIVSKAKYKVPKAEHAKAFTIHNTNRFLSTEKYNTKLYQMVGGKTGTTRAAGSVLITTAKDKHGHEIICAFFGNSSRSQSYKDIKKLLNYTFKQGNSGKLSWKKGFWDVRYRKSKKTIDKYYNIGAIPIDNAFHPTKEDTQKNMVQLINAITEDNYTSLNAKDSMDILDIALIYYKNEAPKITNSTEVTSSGSITGTGYTKEAIDKASKVCSIYENYEVCDDDALIALAYFTEANLLPHSVEKNIDTALTREQVVLLADAINQKN